MAKVLNSCKCSTWARMIGHGMWTVCVSASFAWIGAYALPCCGLPPQVLPVACSDEKTISSAEVTESVAVSSCEGVANDVAWGALCRLGRHVCKQASVVSLFRSLQELRPGRTRVRDIFPLPLITTEVVMGLTIGDSATCNGLARPV